MAGSFNKVVIVGTLGRDPELRNAGGTAVVELSLACERTWYDKKANERKSETTWIPVTLWSKTAETAAKYLTKGRQVLIEGRLQLDTWDDRESGQKRSKLKVTCTEMTMLGGKSEGGDSRSPADSFYDRPPANSTPDEDVPF